MGAGRASPKARVRALGVGALMMVAGTAPALAAGGTLYAGRSSQHRPVSVTVGTFHAGHRTLSGITRLQIVWFARCHGQPFGPLTTFHKGVVVVRGGWNTFGRYTVYSPDHQYIETFSVKDHGTVDARRVHGMFSGTARIVRAADSSLVTSCRSGRIRFTLRART